MDPKTHTYAPPKTNSKLANTQNAQKVPIYEQTWSAKWISRKQLLGICHTGTKAHQEYTEQHIRSEILQIHNAL